MRVKQIQTNVHYLFFHTKYITLQTSKVHEISRKINITLRALTEALDDRAVGVCWVVTTGDEVELLVCRTSNPRSCRVVLVQLLSFGWYILNHSKLTITLL